MGTIAFFYFSVLKKIITIIKHGSDTFNTKLNLPELIPDTWQYVQSRHKDEAA